MSFDCKIATESKCHPELVERVTTNIVAMLRQAQHDISFCAVSKTANHCHPEGVPSSLRSSGQALATEGSNVILSNAKNLSEEKFNSTLILRSLKLPQDGKISKSFDYANNPLTRKALHKPDILFTTLSPPTSRGEDGALRQVRGYKQFINDVELYMAFMALKQKILFETLTPPSPAIERGRGSACSASDSYAKLFLARGSGAYSRRRGLTPVSFAHRPLVRETAYVNDKFLTLSPPTLRGEDGALRQVRGYKQDFNNLEIRMAQAQNTVCVPHPNPLPRYGAGEGVGPSVNHLCKALLYRGKEE